MRCHDDDSIPEQLEIVYFKYPNTSYILWRAKTPYSIFVCSANTRIAGGAWSTNSFCFASQFFFCSRIFISIECLLKVLESANSCYYCGFSVSFQLDRNRNEPDDTADGRKRIVVMPYSSQPLISSMRCALRNRVCVVMYQPWMNYVRIGRDSCFHCTISLLFSNGQPNAIIILFLRRSCCSYALWWFRCIAQYLWSLDRPVGGRQLYELWINSVSVRVQYALS